LAAGTATAGEAALTASFAGFFGGPFVALAAGMRGTAAQAGDLALLGGVHAGETAAAGAAAVADAGSPAGFDGSGGGFLGYEGRALGLSG